MQDAFEELIAAPRSLTDELYGRPAYLKVFLSSKMAGGTYVEERERCAVAIDGTTTSRAWYWERDARAGPYCSEGICLGHAATSDGLILIVGDVLTPITLKEYEVAKQRGIPRFIFVDERQTQSPEVIEFIEREQDDQQVTKKFQNTSELETHVVDALTTFVVQSVRRESLNRHANRQSGRSDV